MTAYPEYFNNITAQDYTILFDNRQRLNLNQNDSMGQKKI